MAIERTIHTDTFSPKAKQILDCLHEYLFDRWGSTQMERNAVLSTVETAPNGEIVWQIADRAERRLNGSWRIMYCWYSNSTFCSRRDDQKVRDWIAMCLKTIVYRQFQGMHLPETKNWKRTNKLNLPAFNGLTVADVYCMYDKLLNRKNFAKRWGLKAANELIGKERDPIATELEIAKRESRVTIEKELEARKVELRHQKDDEFSKLRGQLEGKYRMLEAEAVEAHDKALKELEESTSFLSEANIPDWAK